MKQYGKLIIVGLITVLSLGVFYIDVGNISKSFPEFQINHIAGDAQEAEDIRINGELYYGMTYYDEAFAVDSSGTSYLRDKLLFSRTNEYFREEMIQRLQSEHRNFMRGKAGYGSVYYEDEDMLAYANETYGLGSLHSNKFIIDVLDKKTNKSSGFSVQIPNRADYWYLDIKQIIVLGDELHIITVSEINPHAIANAGGDVQVTTAHSDAYDEITRVNIYTIDLLKQAVSDVKSIDPFAGLGKVNDYREINIVPSQEDNKAEVTLTVNRMVYHESDEETWDDYHGYEEPQTDRVIKYDLMTNEQTDIELAEELGMMIYFSDDFIGYFASLDGKQVEFKQVDLVNNQVIVEGVLDYKNHILNAYSLTEALIEDDKLYLLLSNYDMLTVSATPFYIIDLTTFTVNYEGEVNYSDEARLPDLRYYLNGISTGN